MPVQQPQNKEPFAHWKNGGVVVSKERIYAEVGHKVVAINRKDGSVDWAIDLPDESAMRSIVGTPKHLVMCVSYKQPARNRQAVWEIINPEEQTYLIAVDASNGKEVWREKVPYPGNLAIANGMLYFTDGGLHVFESQKESAEGDIGTTK